MSELVARLWAAALGTAEQLTTIMAHHAAPLVQAVMPSEKTVAAHPWLQAAMPFLPNAETVTFSNLITMTMLVSFFLFNLPYAILYFRPIAYFDQYLIQPKKTAEKTTAVWFDALFCQLSAVALTWVVVATATHLTLEARPDWKIVSDKEAVLATASAWAVAFDLFKGLIVEDFVFYWAHRGLHHPLVYARIHKLHHKFKAPFSLTATFATSTEFILSDVVPLTAAMVLCCRNLFTAICFVVYRLFLTTEVHSGYSFPWSMENILPRFGIRFIAGPKYHDAHHEKTHGNYASNLFWLDDLCGTGFTDTTPAASSAPTSNGTDASYKTKAQ